jgi:hypothetical protein
MRRYAAQHGAHYSPAPSGSRANVALWYGADAQSVQ